MPVVPLPSLPSVEQLKKRARELQRAVRSERPVALALVAEYAPSAVSSGSFTLADAQLVLARHYGFSSWPKLHQHLGDLAAVPRPRGEGTLTVDNRYRVHRGWAAAADASRCARIATDAHPDPARWWPVLTAQHNGVRVVVFGTPAGPLFAELTPATVALSGPGSDHGAPALLFHTAFGTLAGIVPAGTARVALERPADRAARESAVVTDHVFAVPNAFTIDDEGLVLRLNSSRRGLLVPREALPGRADSVTDCPGVPAERESPAGQRLAAALAAADAPPVVDPDRWAPGAYAELASGEHIQLGAYRHLLLWHLTGNDDDEPFVFDFGPKRGPVRDFAVTGETVALTRVYYGFSHGSSDRVVLAGLVDRRRVTSVVLRREDGTELPAVLANGTVLITAPDLTAPRESGTVTDRVIARDAAGTVVEDLPYQQPG